MKCEVEVEEEEKKDTGVFTCSPLVPLWRSMGRNRDLQLNLRHQSVGELEPQLGAPAACRALRCGCTPGWDALGHPRRC